MGPDEENKGNVENLIFERAEITPQFAVGLHIYYELIQKSRRIRARASLIGWWRPYLLLTTFPLVDNRLVVVPSGTEVVVRYLLDGSVYGFMTRLIKKYQDPFPMWALAYPQMVEVKNLRESPRMQTFLQVSNSDGESWLLMDLSENGALIAVNSPKPVGESMLLNFSLPDGTKIENLKATVLRSHNTAHESNIGVKFDEDDQEQIAKIAGYVENCKLCQRPRLPKEFEIHNPLIAEK